jgi:hypothetical protein
MIRPGISRPTRTPLFGAAGALACVAVLTLSPDASAQRVVIYGPAPPPPPPPPVYVYQAPPPPPGYYAYPPPPRRYYYRAEPEPLYALAIGADLEGAIPVNVPRFLDGNNLQGGGGFKLRIGEQIRLRGVRFTPEIGYGFDHLFANDDVGDAYSWDMHRVFAGARLSFGRIVVPVIYAHVGYGWRTTGDRTVEDASGLAFDVGGAIDVRLVPQFSIGVHVEYSTIDAQPYTPEWVALGVHADLAFF